MRLLVLVLVLALSTAFVCASDESDASNVLVLTDENLEAEIAAHKPIFIEFYAPWCGHCKNLAPEWEKVATELVGQVTVAKIDASVHAQAAQEFGIQGFPTLKWIDSGADTDFQVTDYNGARDVASMVSWARRRLQPIPRLNTQELVDLATGVSDVWVLFNFDQDHESYETMRQYALSAESVTFISVFDEAANGIEPGQIFVGSNWISKQQYTDELSALPVWVNRNAYPLVQQVESNGALVFSRLFSSGLPFALVFLNEESQEENIAELNQIAEELRSVFLFAWLDTAQWADVLPRLGASGTYLPTAIAWDGSQAQQRPLVWDEDKTFTFLGLKHWAIDIANGVGTSWRQSQPIPTEQPGPVHQIVWKTWAQDVEESSVPVFVEFYSPGCGHCKALQPTWDDLAETFNTDKQVVIAKYDATANYAKDEWEIQGYPTLKLFKQGAQPVDYNGARDLESLIAFVEENI